MSLYRFSHMNSRGGNAYYMGHMSVPTVREAMVGTRGQPGWVQKMPLPQGFDSQTVWPEASHYTNYVIPATPDVILHLSRSAITSNYT
jgi:hypothetical protein